MFKNYHAGVGFGGSLIASRDLNVQPLMFIAAFSNFLKTYTPANQPFASTQISVHIQPLRLSSRLPVSPALVKQWHARHYTPYHFGYHSFRGFLTKEMKELATSQANFSHSIHDLLGRDC
jgi:hypothetical protein